MINRQISTKAGNGLSIYFPSEKQLSHYQAPAGYIFRYPQINFEKDSDFKGNRSEVKICLEVRRGSVLRDMGSRPEDQSHVHTHTHARALK